MYESHFGLTGPPFQLNPDPAFYFASRGHGSALAYLKFGAHQGEGFIVVTGEIGAGKTTLVKTLLASLDRSRLVAAQVVSTQLESGDLLRTILTAFGVAPTGTTKAHLIATLEGFLTAVAAKGRRALLIVDEAQNLDRGAVEELRMLSNFQLGNQGLLQSFLVGQPELRVLLQSKSMEQLRQRVIASCHLGPLDAEETRAYVEHRLHHVGWKGNPAFDDEAHDQIHHWTGGIPRRINRLCNRLLLGAFLTNQQAVTAEAVNRTAVDLGSEIGESLIPALPIGRRHSATANASGTRRPAEGSSEIDVQLRSPTKPADPLICIVDSLAAYLQAGALDHAFANRPTLPSIVAVHVGSAADLIAGAGEFDDLPLPAVDIHLQVGSVDNAATAGLALARFESVLDEYGPTAVMAMGNGNAVLACALLAHKRGVPLLRNNAGRRRSWSKPGDEANALLLDRAADVLYAENVATHELLERSGSASDRVHCVGDLAANVVQSALAGDGGRRATRAVLELAKMHVSAGAGFALVTKQFLTQGTPVAELLEVLSVLATMRSEIPLVWAVQDNTLREIEAQGAVGQLRTAGIGVIPGLGYLDCISLLGRSRFLIAGSEAQFVDEAKVLGLASLVMAAGHFVAVRTPETLKPGVPIGGSELVRYVKELAAAGVERSAAPAVSSDGAAVMIGAHLDTWLRMHNRTKSRLREAQPTSQASRLPTR